MIQTIEKQYPTITLAFERLQKLELARIGTFDGKGDAEDLLGFIESDLRNLKKTLWNRQPIGTSVDNLWLQLGVASKMAALIITQDEIHDYTDQEYELFCSKTHDYGIDNIYVVGEDRDWARIRLLMRTNDKYERLKNLYKHERVPKNEAIADSWKDMSVYAKIAQIVEINHWHPN